MDKQYTQWVLRVVSRHDLPVFHAVALQVEQEGVECPGADCLLVNRVVSFVRRQALLEVFWEGAARDALLVCRPSTRCQAGSETAVDSWVVVGPPLLQDLRAAAWYLGTHGVW